MGAVNMTLSVAGHTKSKLPAWGPIVGLGGSKKNRMCKPLPLPDIPQPPTPVPLETPPVAGTQEQYYLPGPIGGQGDNK